MKAETETKPHLLPNAKTLTEDRNGVAAVSGSTVEEGIVAPETVSLESRNIENLHSHKSTSEIENEATADYTVPRKTETKD